MNPSERATLIALGAHELSRCGIDGPLAAAERILQTVERLIVGFPKGPVDPRTAYQQSIRGSILGTPPEYVLGYQRFYGRHYEVNPRVFIPRPRTEVLVARALDILRARPSKILEIGTGSGAIAATISLEADAKVYATDISQDALKVAEANSVRLGARVEHVRADLLQPFVLPSQVLVIANLPYTSSETPKVRLLRGPCAEPLSAITAGPDGISAYRSLIHQAQGQLEPGGTLLIQIDQQQAVLVLELLRERWSEVLCTPLDDVHMAIEARLVHRQAQSMARVKGEIT